ncbi:MAG TPA: dienelactone hydrolase family protein [Phycisphaerae bacterium]|nr:dienelactone hydrolase family protein [Phycisphaerae bacterium]HNU44872.1 dienelactone hydrolase family protein [Phycisphaerae bacterium]
MSVDYISVDVRRARAGVAGQWAAALGIALCATAAHAGLSDPGPYGAGWVDVSVPRPSGGSFDAVLFYPATTSGPGAPYTGAGAPYPAISFGHGWITSVSRYQSTLEHLATWGYFVLASKSYGGLFPDHSAFADDLRWCLSYLEGETANPASWLYGQVDSANFAVAGHSMGGGASILAAARDGRIRALANLAAAETTPSAIAALADVRVPVCLIAGDEDSIVPPSGHTIPMYDNAQAPRRLPLLDGGWHCGFLDSSFFGCDSGSLPRATQLALTRGLLTGFFQLYLKGDQTVWRQVWGPEVHSNPLVDNARLDAGIVLDPAQAELHGCGGQTVATEFLLTNSGPLPTSFTLYVEDNAWLTTPTPAQTAVLGPGESAPIGVTVEIEAGPGTLTDAALISACADLDGGTRSYATLMTERRVPGDLNGDGAVNGADLAAFIDCLTGPQVAPLSGCDRADLDLDADVDLADFAVFQVNFGAGS